MQTKLLILRVWGDDLPQGGRKTGTTVLPLELPSEVREHLEEGWVIVDHSSSWASMSLFVTLRLERAAGD